MLSDEAMISLIPTDGRTTSDLVELYNTKACEREQINMIYAAGKEVGICDSVHFMYNDLLQEDQLYWLNSKITA
jgi:hypothetical protein